MNFDDFILTSLKVSGDGETKDYIQSEFRRLYTDTESTNVTLVCDDSMSVQAHGLVLSACSPVFRDVLENTSSEIVYIEGVDIEDLKTILQLIYLGKVIICRFQIPKNIENINKQKINANFVILKEQQKMFTSTRQELITKEVK